MSAIPKLLPFRSAVVPEDVPPSGRGSRSAGAAAIAPARAALISPDDQAQAEQRLEMIQSLLDYDREPERFAVSKSQLIEALCEHHNVGRATLLRWQSAYRLGGLPALADRQRSDKGRSRWFEANKRAAWAAAYLHHECRQSYRAVHEALCADRELLQLTDLPSYETVRKFLDSAPPYLRAYALRGRRVYQERMAPYVTRGYLDVAPHQITVSDHMIHDVYVRNVSFPEAEYGARIRLRLTALLDFRARYAVGTSWCWEGSSRSIATAMRRAIAQYGPSEHFYCDNGKDYLKVARGAVPGYLRDPEAIRGWHEREMAQIERVGILARLGIRVTHCLVRHPQSKHVERFFRTLHERFDKSFHQSYSGPAPHLRPDAASAALALHGKLQREGRSAESTLPASDFFIALCMEWIEEYHHRAHGGKGMEGLTPAQVFESRAIHSTAPDSAAMTLLLDVHERLKVHECAVQWTPVPKGGKRRFTFFDDDSRHILHSLNDTEVVVAYDPNDLDVVAILDDAGHFLTWAKAERHLRMAPDDPETQQAIAASMQDRRHLEKMTRTTLETISRTARAMGVRTPVERLADGARLAPVIEPALTHRAPKPKPSVTAKAPMSAADIAEEFLEDLK